MQSLREPLVQPRSRLWRGVGAGDAARGKTQFGRFCRKARLE